MWSIRSCSDMKWNWDSQNAQILLRTCLHAKWIKINTSILEFFFFSIHFAKFSLKEKVFWSWEGAAVFFTLRNLIALSSNWIFQQQKINILKKEIEYFERKKYIATNEVKTFHLGIPFLGHKRWNN